MSQTKLLRPILGRSCLSGLLRRQGRVSPHLNFHRYQSLIANDKLNALVKASIAQLQNRVTLRQFPDPYKELNNLERLDHRKLLGSFEKQIDSVLSSDTSKKSSNDLTITDYFRPHMGLLIPITALLISEQYPQELMKYEGHLSLQQAHEDLINKLFHQHYVESMILRSPDTKRVETYWDVTRPAEWFPTARKMRRKVIMHVGPTNSGKTHTSLQAFASAKSGYYAGPLRLLAREIYERFTSSGINCNLITGEEVIPSLDKFGNIAGLSSGTIEMIPLHKKMDICVIDEIQMIADPMRGSAWTNALLGVQAKELHLCGEESAVSLVRELVKSTGDELEVKKYSRLGKLTIEKKPITKFENLKKGDCLVVFSKRKILELKCKIENTTKLKVGVVYGALPPEIRSQESLRFNNGEYDVLVASDAIGMGLNLKIKRIIFYSMVKFNGFSLQTLSVSAAKQIAGRAGRFSADKGELEGFVTTFNAADLRVLREKMSQGIADLDKACIWPLNEFWMQYLSSFRASKPLKNAVAQFYRDIRKSRLDNYFLSEFEHQTQLILLMEDRGLTSELTLEDQLRLVQTPINLQNADPEIVESTIDFLKCISRGTSKTVFDLGFLHKDILTEAATLQKSSEQILEMLARLENDHKLVLVFMWLAQRWPTYFIDKESASEVKTMIEKRISEELEVLRFVSKARGLSHKS